MVIELTSERFDKEVIASELPCIVDFYAEWCGPCADLAPVLDQVSEKFSGKIKFFKVDSDKQKDLRIRFRIAVLPWVILFYKGKKIVLADSIMSAEKFLERIPEALQMIEDAESGTNELASKLVSDI